MTREALRARCEAFISDYGDDCLVKESIEVLMNLLAAERAAEAAEIAKEAADRAYQIGINEPLHTNYLYIFKQWCEARDAAWREKE